MTIPEGPCLTLWHDDGPAAAWAARASRELIERARPPIVRVHGRPRGLVREARGVTDALRAALPGVEVIWAVAGDADGPSVLVARWTEAARAANDAGVAQFELNCETAWKRSGRGELAARALAALDPLPVRLGFTSFGMVTSHRAVPWRVFVGQGSPVEWACWQDYWSTAVGAPRRGPGVKWEARYRASRDAATREGLIRRHGLAHGVYTYGAACHVADLCTVGAWYRHHAYWVAPGYFGRHGRAALAWESEVWRRGLWTGEGDRVRRAQAAAGVEVDGIVYRETLRAFGVDLDAAA